jgi:phosphonate transport system substrate-binding protein
MLGTQGLPALQNGEVDAWGGSSARYAEFLEEQDLSESALPPIVKGPLLPKDIFVANSKLATNFVEEIRLGIVKNHDKVIQSLSSVDRGKYKDSKLVLANDSDYEMIRDVYKAIGQGSFVH